MTVRRGVLSAVSFLTFANVGFPCSVERIPSAAELVKRADVIVRARAEGLSTSVIPEHLVPPGTTGTQVRFRVVEILKGALPTKTLEISGVLSEQDDPNDRPVPYDFVRRSGRRGSCFAVEYRQGAEYLLFLKRGLRPVSVQRDDLTPYWAPLAATNEQLFGSDDPWLIWARQSVSPDPPNQASNKALHPSAPPKAVADSKRR